jgi:hypothetical protein
MRIRSIKPEFWRSDDIDKLSWHHRLIFIGLWSYVDDNGVGIDKLSNITAELFAHDLSTDPIETLSRVESALATLSTAGLVDRYTVENKSYLYITNWDDHQRVNNPNKPRFPLPTSGNAVPATPLHSSDVDPQQGLATGTEEQGNRGTGENYLSSPQAATETERPNLELIIDAEPEPEPAPKANAYTPDFEEFWKLYPRTAGKGAAAKAYDNARKVIGYAPLLERVKEFASDPNLPTGDDAQFIPHASRWLNERRWEDGPLPVRRGAQQPVSRKEQTLAFLHQEFLKGDDSPPPFGAVTQTTRKELTA